MFGKHCLLELLALPLARTVILGSSTDFLAKKHPNSQTQAVLQSADCPPFSTNRTVQSGRSLRSYFLSVPVDFEETPSGGWPLIVDFHGRNSTPEKQWNNSQYFLNPSGKEYLVAYPLGCLGEGHPGKPAETAWQGAPYANPSCDDISFTADLVEDVKECYNIDETRIYASGKSNGGGFVDTLACSPTGDLFAAFAMAAAALYTDVSNDGGSCVGGRPRAILEAHGAADDIVPMVGRRKGRVVVTPNIARWAGWWVERNGCHPDEDRSITRESWGLNTTYSCPGEQNFVQQYNVSKLAHCWPSVVNNTDSQTQNGTCLDTTLDFTQAVVEFFALRRKAL